MYIKLGTIGVNYTDPSVSDFLIFSEVPDSTLSYETPRLVRNTDELDIWFSRSISDYPMLAEILNHGGSLLLYGPLDSSPKLDISEWPEVWLDSGLAFPETYIETATGEAGKKYNINGTWCIYQDGVWIKENEIETHTPGLDNRDSLIISSGTGLSCGYANFIDSKLQPSDSNLQVIDLSGEGNTWSIKINSSGDSLGDGFFVWRDAGTEKIYLFGQGSSELFPNARIEGTGNNMSDLRGYLESQGFIRYGDYYYRTQKFEYLDIVSGDIEIIRSEEFDNRLIQRYIDSLPSTSGRLKFWSKTVGRDLNEYSDSRDITVKIERLGPDEWRIEIGRYSYSEIFTGNFREGLEYKISKESKLVYCEVYGGDYDFVGGEYKLLGAKVIVPSSFRPSLRVLQESDIIPDFLLIPYLSLFGERDDMKLFYDTNYQTLIDDRSEEEIRGNVVWDKENRLVYFTGDLKIHDISYPSYYPFILGVMENISVYTSPTIEYNNPYAEDFLDAWKCNYLVSNNQRYYYKKYNSGENYETTAWTRFIIGKVYRELEKNKWSYLGTRAIGMVKNTIDRILYKIASRFSNVRSISISSFLPVLESNSLYLTIDLYLTDLVDNNITLDILINYGRKI